MGEIDGRGPGVYNDFVYNTLVDSYIISRKPIGSAIGGLRSVHFLATLPQWLTTVGCGIPGPLIPAH